MLIIIIRQHAALHTSPPKSLTVHTAEDGDVLVSALEDHRRCAEHAWPEPPLPGSCTPLRGWNASVCSAKWHPPVCNVLSKLTCSKEIIIIHGTVATPIHGCLVFSAKFLLFDVCDNSALRQSFLRLTQRKVVKNVSIIEVGLFLSLILLKVCGRDFFSPPNSLSFCFFLNTTF